MSAPEPTQVSERPSSLRRFARWAVVPLVLLWLFGLIGFLRADGVVRLSMPRREQPGSGDLNLASYRYGPTVRASSYYREPVSQHHPMFLVDERRSPTLVEKWASTSYDKAPWVEIEWREPRTLERVVVRHAGIREEESMTVRRYTLRCLGGKGGVLEVNGNREAVAVHALPCSGARGVRLEFTPNEPGDLVRVFEVEAWGR